MTQVKHTPGPWRVGPYYKHEVVSGDGVICCAPIETEQHRVNALLIAAAPDLLEALRFVNRLYSTIGGVLNPEHYGLIANSPECGKMINAVREAIAKAEGHTTGVQEVGQ